MLNIIVCKINLNEHIWNMTDGRDGVEGCEYSAHLAGLCHFLK